MEKTEDDKAGEDGEASGVGARREGEALRKTPLGHEESFSGCRGKSKFGSGSLENPYGHAQGRERFRASHRAGYLSLVKIQARTLAAELDKLPRSKMEDCAMDPRGHVDVLVSYDGDIGDFLAETGCEVVLGLWSHGLRSGVFVKVDDRYAVADTDENAARSLDLWPAGEEAARLAEAANSLKNYAALVSLAEARFDRENAAAKTRRVDSLTGRSP